MMKEGKILLSFYSDMMEIQRDFNDLVALIPPGITKEEDLFQSLNEQLHFPIHFGRNWDALDEILSFWIKQPEIKRAVIIHQDLPFFGQIEHGWYWLKIYLEILIKNIDWIQNHSEKKLMVVFPLETASVVSDVLLHPPVWELEFGFREQSISMLIDPSWPQIARVLEGLDGFTSETCTLARKGAGQVNIYYLRRKAAYWIEYVNQSLHLMVVVDDNATSPEFCTLLQTQSILKDFFLDGQCPVSWHWLPLDGNEMRDCLEYFSYPDDETAFLEGNNKIIRETIIQGILDTPLDAGNTSSVGYWKAILLDQAKSVPQHITALCVIGSSNVPEKTALLRPFLESAEKKERWVSSILLGKYEDVWVAPLLLAMLADELPLLGKESWSEQDHWYENWCLYVPKLLRRWQTEEVLISLRQALAQCIQIASFFDPDSGFWREYEFILCYELGYRGDLVMLIRFALDDNRLRTMMIDAARGFLSASKKFTFYEEYLQQSHFHDTFQEDIIAILGIYFSLSRNVAEKSLKEYLSDNEFNIC